MFAFALRKSQEWVLWELVIVFTVNICIFTNGRAKTLSVNQPLYTGCLWEGNDL